MKLGVSTYSLYKAIAAGELSPVQVVEEIAAMGGEHVEVVPIGFSLTERPELIGQIRDKAQELGLEVSNYAIGANFYTETEEARQQEIERVKGEVEIARQLGVKLMRHDVASAPDTSIQAFNARLDKLADACRQVADYAAEAGITTSVENHGYFVQASDRVQALVAATDRANFKTTLDIGNFMVVDEDSVAAVKKNIGIASMVHIKDFYLRPGSRGLGEGWFKTASGNALRGAIAGHGDIDMHEVLRTIKHAGYDGYLSIEFEGMEECKLGARLALENVKRIWDEV
ncbi:sugar phosphate isomerase/epimerase [Paenibacillus sp. IB182496]|uniref:Sugar phosphate isomerase/epimerase n=1 Tax=Paenibacillus sabuli TaxID=2772509 RepID=A0A927BTG9_9BACL|nr:sugar phosphate isomerase/epimerase [Paenibacillus sabuli]MBD2846492.1 sugar phosphate isomerase/epimerase [Paenibacillus sabuli]